MTAHYHGTPITPQAVFDQLAGCYFCVSHARPENIERAHEIGAGVMLDNRAWSVFTGKAEADWPGYYRWAEHWLEHDTTWAVIPDVVNGDEATNDALIEAWPHGHRGAPVWHMHEAVGRLISLCQAWPRVCIGSSRAYRQVGSTRWHWRMSFALNQLCEEGTPPPAKIHMLRGMAMAGSIYPFSSVDSTDIARNHNRPQNTAAKMAARWASQRCPPCWWHRAVQEEFDALHI